MWQQMGWIFVHYLNITPVQGVSKIGLKKFKPFFILHFSAPLSGPKGGGQRRRKKEDRGDPARHAHPLLPRAFIHPKSLRWSMLRLGRSFSVVMHFKWDWSEVSRGDDPPHFYIYRCGGLIDRGQVRVRGPSEIRRKNGELRERIAGKWAPLK